MTAAKPDDKDSTLTPVYNMLKVKATARPLDFSPGEVWDALAVAERQIAGKQAVIDRLMLEYCPEEMTEAQTAEWAKHQRPAPLPECGTLEFWKNEAGRFEESNRQAQEAIDGLRQELANVVSTSGQGWILTSERKPTERGEYFVYCANTGNRTILAWNGELWIESLDTKNPDGYWTKFVTHWQPMPGEPVALSAIQERCKHGVWIADHCWACNPGKQDTPLPDFDSLASPDTTGVLK